MLSASIGCSIWVWIKTDYIFTPWLASVVSLFLFFELLRYVNRTLRDVTYFLDALYYDDFSLLPKRAVREKKFKLIYDRIREIRDGFRLAKIGKEEELNFLRAAIQSAPIGLLAWDESGVIQLFNQALQNTIGINPVETTARFRKLRPLFWTELEKIPTGTTGVIQYTIDDEVYKLSARIMMVSEKNRSYKMALIQNIGSELEQAEMGAWEKLIKILTHELMNGVTIITSLSSTMVDQLKSEAPNLDDLKAASGAIAKRSNGLMQFVDDYRSLTQIPAPKMEETNLNEWISQLFDAWAPTYPNIEFNLVKGRGFKLKFDQNLIRQVFENLLLNSVHALKETTSPKIEIEIQANQQGIRVSFTDYGSGMDEDTLDQVLIPFFTTRQDGSGIGLALSRQIMRMHKGSLHIHSKLGEGTKIWLQFAS